MGRFDTRLGQSSATSGAETRPTSGRGGAKSGQRRWPKWVPLAAHAGGRGWTKVEQASTKLGAMSTKFGPTSAKLGADVDQKRLERDFNTNLGDFNRHTHWARVLTKVGTVHTNRGWVDQIGIGVGQSWGISSKVGLVRPNSEAGAPPEFSRTNLGSLGNPGLRNNDCKCVLVPVNLQFAFLPVRAIRSVAQTPFNRISNSASRNVIPNVGNTFPMCCKSVGHVLSFRCRC